LQELRAYYINRLSDENKRRGGILSYFIQQAS
jgi:hypothetical protein